MIRRIAALATALLLGLATTAAAQVLAFPANARITLAEDGDLGSYDVPTGIWDAGALPVISAEGQVSRQAWRVDAVGLTTLQLIRPLRDQLRDAGFDVFFECQTEACGGFDFRFATPVLPPPEMVVNLGDFRFLSARGPDTDTPVYLTLIVSRTAQAGFVQVTRVGPAEGAAAPLAGPAAPAMRQGGTQTDDLGAQLDVAGRVVLDDLAFASGAATLDGGPFASLAALAAYLRDRPDVTITLVGHTDYAGGMAANMALSKRRAEAVRNRLVTDLQVAPRRVAAEGAGYLAPIASNATEAGRIANRRVEAVVTARD